MIKSIIVARSTNYVIGNKNQLPWKMPTDLQYFKKITLGHHLLMGRKTFDAVGKLLPNRITIILTHQKNYHLATAGSIVTHTLQDAFDIGEKAGENELFIAGGSEIYRQSLDIVNKIYLTEIHTTVVGDTFFPPLDPRWIEIKRMDYQADKTNPYDYSFVELIAVRFRNFNR